MSMWKLMKIIREYLSDPLVWLFFLMIIVGIAAIVLALINGG